ncbi:cation transporter [Methylobacterium sp. WSM2598]|uniref:cation transporter n=1 Tax=Methylobacterium sp. WSM2598 TaxID=398261 RepID=UPI00036EACA3|nr:cation transporter [Methylobacterium sp. WSM2598]
MVRSGPVESHRPGSRRAYTRTVWVIAIGTLAVAVAQGAYALAIGSDSLLDESRGFGFDIVLNAVAALVFGRGERVERLSALLVAAIMAASGAQSLLDGWRDLTSPDKTSTGLVALSLASSLSVSALAAAALSRFRDDPNPLIEATWLNARNDAVSNALIGAVSFGSFLASASWVDCGLDLMAAFLSFQAAGAILLASLRRHAPAGPACAPTLP